MQGFILSASFIVVVLGNTLEDVKDFDTLMRIMSKPRKVVRGRIH